MVSAEETQVVQVGGASVGPVGDVVGVGPAWVSATSGHHTVTVSGYQRPAGRSGNGPGFTSHVDDL